MPPARKTAQESALATSLPRMQQQSPPLRSTRAWVRHVKGDSNANGFCTLLSLSTTRDDVVTSDPCWRLLPPSHASMSRKYSEKAVARAVACRPHLPTFSKCIARDECVTAEFFEILLIGSWYQVLQALLHSGRCATFECSPPSSSPKFWSREQGIQ